MLTLALDLSTTRTGWCLGRNGRPEKWGAIEPPKKEDLAARISFVAVCVSRLIEHHKPDHVVIEELHFARNMNVIRALAGVRGAVMARVWEITGKSPEFVNRMTALKSLGVKRSEGKEAVGRALLMLGYEIQGEDERDAAATLIAHWRQP